MTASKMARRSGSPLARPASSTVAVMAPGPAISGMASGKAAMLRTRSSRASSACCDWRPMRTPNTISEAIENSSSPPAMRKAGRVIDSVRNSQSPISAAPASTMAAISAGAQATPRRDGSGMPWVMAMKVGTRPMRVDHDDERDQSGDEEFDRHDGADATRSGPQWLAKTVPREAAKVAQSRP